MSKLRRLVLMRHGETTGQSSIRFHGSTDVALSDEGRAQMRTAARGLVQECFDLVVASALRRSWQAAAIVAAGAPVRLEHGFNEIDFGRWEGLTKEEIEASDPVPYADWQAKVEDFEFPGGETRADFRARVEQGPRAASGERCDERARCRPQGHRSQHRRVTARQAPRRG